MTRYALGKETSSTVEAAASSSSAAEEEEEKEEGTARRLVSCAGQARGRREKDGSSRWQGIWKGASFLVEVEVRVKDAKASSTRPVQLTRSRKANGFS